MSFDCFGHASFVTVIITGAHPHALHVKTDGYQSRGIVSDVLELQEQWPDPSWEGRNVSLTTPNSTTNPLTATALIYALGAGITAGAGTRLVLQLLLDI
jgi:hypothetical protein